VPGSRGRCLLDARQKILFVDAASLDESKSGGTGKEGGMRSTQENTRHLVLIDILATLKVDSVS